MSSEELIDVGQKWADEIGAHRVTLDRARAAEERVAALQADNERLQAALGGAIDGTNDLLDKLLRAEKARAVKVTADAIHKAQKTQADMRRERE